MLCIKIRQNKAILLGEVGANYGLAGQVCSPGRRTNGSRRYRGANDAWIPAEPRFDQKVIMLWPEAADPAIWRI